MTKNRVRRTFTPEFKAEIVELCRRGDRPIGTIAREHDLTHSAVRTWVKEANVTVIEHPVMNADEREELAWLRQENRLLREDVTFLKRVAAYFASEVPQHQ